MKNVKCKIRGLAPLLMHNSRLANPQDPYSRKIYELTTKRKKDKTDEDYAEMQRLEFMGGIYERDGVIGIPGEMIEGVIVSGFKLKRKGDVAKRGIICDGFWPLIYNGPKDAAGLWNDGGFVDFRCTRVQSARIFRTRPCFREWSLDFDLLVDSGTVDLETVEEGLVSGGLERAIGDYRPRYGRFDVEDFREVRS